MKPRILTLLLILTMCTNILGACSNNGSTTPDTDASTDVTSEDTMDDDSEADSTATDATMNISDVRDAADGTSVQTTGVVAAITYSFGKVPSGIILVDNTQSIYVYDSTLAQQVSVGNTITISGSKTHWILEDEAKNAAKFGYNGCCQIEKITLISNDGKTTDYDKSWIPASTVKELLETPMENDITTSIYKVNALVKKVPGKDFFNYYFFDIDGETGTYTYTQCSGADFAWLDAFDGKICTVYLTALNAKASASECFYRLLPIEVIDDEYTFDKKTTAEHVVTYYGVDQFESFYSGNPELELRTSVSSDLLGFENAILSYVSDNTDIISFETTASGDKATMNCHATGTANITITGTFDGISYSKTIPITVELASTENYDYVSVKDAISANVNDIVSVKGIVGPSLVNKDGFYLIDDTGVIAVLMDSALIDTLEIGHEIVVKGTRDHFTKGGTTYYGQTCMTNCEVLVNSYGRHTYSTATFDDSITLADFYNLDPTVDYSTSVYILKATVEIVETNYYTNIQLVDGSTKVSLYCSSANQYSWLKEYVGQEVTLEIAPCNWNSKNYYRGCVLAVYTEDGKVVNELNFMN